MQTANIKGLLRSIIEPNAAFRRQQKKVIQAIIHKAELFVQITGIEGGKSLLFILLAYCILGGIIITIILLVLLQKDLHN